MSMELRRQGIAGMPRKGNLLLYRIRHLRVLFVIGSWS